VFTTKNDSFAAQNQSTFAMSFLSQVIHEALVGINELYNIEIDHTQLPVNETRREFEGDYTLVLFGLTKLIGKSPDAIGAELGEWMLHNGTIISGHNTVKGFLNLSLQDDFWKASLSKISTNSSYGDAPYHGKKVMVEFSSPNTNKPLHLGHIRNILLGWSCYKILKAAGHDVTRVQIINDRGIAICKSMLAWKKFGDGATPSTSQTKGDHFVGDYYVRFEQEFQIEYKAFQSSVDGIALYETSKKGDQTPEEFWKAYKNNYFNEYSSLGREAKAMLLNWESGDAKTLATWRQMNRWVYDGFDKTYASLGVEFDKLYYESETYLLGKKIVDKGLSSGQFYRQEDGSVWVDLEDAGMDRKILLRSDGSSVYITQDLGTALQRYEDLGSEQMIYTVADEQDYHFKVLFEILKRLGEPYADGLYHLSYGMIELTTGKMKSREGTVVDADDLVDDVINEARTMSSERGEIAALPLAEQDDILRKIGLGALKYFIIKVSPKKRMVFNPTESVDMQGQTGPYIQNAYVRIQSILRKAATEPISSYESYMDLAPQEKILMRHILSYPTLVLEAARQYDPSSIANFAYELAKDYHRMYHDVRILGADTAEAKSFRITLSENVGRVLAHAMDLLGIEMPERM
jgi:arginyl-tRNA synthetase